jgi:hypothetical protein
MTHIGDAFHGRFATVDASSLSRSRVGIAAVIAAIPPVAACRLLGPDQHKIPRLFCVACADRAQKDDHAEPNPIAPARPSSIKRAHASTCERTVDVARSYRAVMPAERITLVLMVVF